MDKDSEFLKRIQATFRIEADEHLQLFSKDLIELENSEPGQSKVGLIETMFREVHSLKGAARSVGQKEIESLCQPLENIFSCLKRQEINLTPVTFDVFHQTVGLLSQLVSSDGVEQIPGIRQKLRDLIQQLKQIDSEAKPTEIKEESSSKKEEIPIEPSPEVNSKPQPMPEFRKDTRQAFAEVVRIPISKLDPLLLEAEEFIQANSSINQQMNELQGILDEVVDWKTEWTNRKGRSPATTNIQKNEWQEKNELRLINLETRLAVLVHAMERDTYSHDRMVNDHLDSMKQILMLPVSFLVEVFPSMVREISREHQKEIELIIRGSELEIDKRILEELKDPLIHLIRNSIDHGIGTPKERMLQNKPSKGKIGLTFTARENGQLEIMVSDDGKGIDCNRVLNAAIKSEMITPEAAKKLTNDEILSLVFYSGLSTSSMITDLSGRGLGLSIVREKVERLNGKLSITTKELEGTNFCIHLPMTMAAFRGILVRLDEYQFFLPAMNVERVMRVKPEEIMTVENHETIRFGDDILSVVSLAEVLGLPERQTGTSGLHPIDSQITDHIRMLVLISGEIRMAFKVDEILDEHRVLVKGLGKLLKRVRNISGATILGNGKVVPVLHVPDLMKSALRNSGKKKGTSDEVKTMEKTLKILVAEDSITSRTLLKNILETAGYQVVVAVDGIDAFTRAKSEEFDLIVSDVDMPRMNGFELTVKIKSDKKLSEIPVVLVTSLDSREDKERGIEVGADAYIIKSRFDQGNLLEVIKKLI